MLLVVNYYVVYDISGSAVNLGLTGLFQAIPALTLGLFAGVLADAVSRKKLLLFSQIGNLAPGVALGLLALTDSIQVWHIFLFTLVTSAMTFLGRPAQLSFVSQLVPASHLLNAITLNSTIMRGAFFLGPLAGGFFIAWGGVSSAYFFNGLLAAITVVSVVAIRTSGEPQSPNRGISMHALFEGLQYVWWQRVLLAMFLLDFGVVLVGFFRPLLPILAKDVFEVGAAGLGVLNAAPAVGSFLGAATLLLAARVRRKGVLTLITTLCYSLGLTVLGASSWFWLGVIALGALGYTDSITVTVRQTVTQLVTPNQLRGRATSFMSVFSQSANALGTMEAGFVAALLGASGALLVGGAVSAGVVVFIGLGWHQLWQYRSDE